MNDTRTAVALLAKAPEAGKVKTRFCPPCNPAQAAEFATAFLLDTAAMLSSPTVQRRVDLFISYSGDPAQLDSLVPGELVLQRGENLSERIGNVVEDLFDRSYERVVILAADCPTVDAQYLLAAIDGLDESDVVFGPARDGGCVLVALGCRQPSIFTDVQMSTDHVCTDMIGVSGELGLTATVMSERYDLDTYLDLQGALEAGELEHAEHTLEAIQSVRLEAT